jgi:hypothetical protein
MLLTTFLLDFNLLYCTTPTSTHVCCVGHLLRRPLDQSPLCDIHLDAGLPETDLRHRRPPLLALGVLGADPPGGGLAVVDAGSGGRVHDRVLLCAGDGEGHRHHAARQVSLRSPAAARAGHRWYLPAHRTGVAPRQAKEGGLIKQAH